MEGPMRDKSFDSSLSLLRDGYMFMRKKREMNKADVIEGRLMLRKAYFVSGRDAAQMFYSDRLKRKNAVPLMIQKTLMGSHGVHSLDGGDHHHRKAMFMSFMTDREISRFMTIQRKHWLERTEMWKKRKRVVLFDEARAVFCESACQWTGVPLRKEEARQRTDDMWAMVDAFGAVGLRHLRGRRARRRTENWIMPMIDDIRKAPEGNDSMLGTVAMHRDRGGSLTDRRVAAVEVINIIRPVVAIAIYVAFLAHALRKYPGWKRRLADKDSDAEREAFVHEVRRLYPFVPILGARVREDFEWQGTRFRKNAMVVLDVHGINHDPRIWELPDEFHPERFFGWQDDQFSFIPQGGGDYHTGHRCPGERVTIESLKLALEILAPISYHVPPQDMNVPLSRMPSILESGFVIEMPESGVSRNAY